MTRGNKPAKRSNTTGSAGKRQATSATTSLRSGPSGRATAKAHDWTPAVKWAFRLGFALAIILLVNRCSEEVHYASIGRDMCQPVHLKAEYACGPDGRCLNPQELRIVAMQMGLDRHQRCRLDQPVTVQDWAGKAWKAVWTPAQENLDSLELVTQTAESEYPEPPSLKSGMGGPEAEPPAE